VDGLPRSSPSGSSIDDLVAELKLSGLRPSGPPAKARLAVMRVVKLPVAATPQNRRTAEPP
jgi:hypothetical protein